MPLHSEEEVGMDGRMVQRRRFQDGPLQGANAGLATRRSGGRRPKGNRRALERRPSLPCPKHGPLGEQVSKGEP